MAASTNQGRAWGIVAILAGLALAAAYLLDWLGLSVDAIVRDEVLVDESLVGGQDLALGIAILIVAAVIVVMGISAVARPLATTLPGALVALAGLASIALAAFVYFTRDDIFTEFAVDATATQQVPAAAVERAIDLALRGGVTVEPGVGLLLAGAAGLVALAAGIFLMVRPREASSDTRARAEDATAATPMSGPMPTASPEATMTVDEPTSPELGTPEERTETLPPGPDDETPPLGRS